MLFVHLSGIFDFDTLDLPEAIVRRDDASPDDRFTPYAELVPGNGTKDGEELAIP